MPVMNTFWKNFRLTTFWESHWVALWAIIDGCPAWIQLKTEDIQYELDRRKPWTNNMVSARKEEDICEILSGVFEWKTIWTPICVIVRNKDHKSQDYSNIKDLYRPWHADKAWHLKFGLRDYRGWGRSSWRETLSRVIGWAIAKQLLNTKFNIDVFGHTIQIWHIKTKSFDRSSIETNTVRSADLEAWKQMEELILDNKQKWDSLWWIVSLHIQNLPSWLWEPVFGKLQAILAHSLFSIATIRYLKILPFDQAFKWSEFNTIDSWISWWISTWHEIVLELWIRPVASISIPQNMESIDWGMQNNVVITWRHDTCIIPRVIPVIEAMTYLALADLYLESRLNII